MGRPKDKSFYALMNGRSGKFIQVRSTGYVSVRSSDASRSEEQKLAIHVIKDNPLTMDFMTTDGPSYLLLDDSTSGAKAKVVSGLAISTVSQSTWIAVESDDDDDELYE